MVDLQIVARLPEETRLEKFISLKTDLENFLINRY
jgi:hypothetical protein